MADMSGRSKIVHGIWKGLQGSWKLNRKLSSTNAGEPSGECTGFATFSERQPTIFVDKDGKFQSAKAEMVYTERGEFTMDSIAINGMKFPFSRKYVWRLQDIDSTSPEVSVWFVKPGTEDIDYLFHKFSWQRSVEECRSRIIDFTGGHLCIEDFYSSQYTFHTERSTSQTSENADTELLQWEMMHEVRGPKKDQLITTQFEHEVQEHE